MHMEAFHVESLSLVSAAPSLPFSLLVQNEAGRSIDPREQILILLISETRSSVDIPALPLRTVNASKITKEQSQRQALPVRETELIRFFFHL
jgi:hypothetical protein